MAPPTQRLRDLNRALPAAPAPRGAYRAVRQHNDVVYIAGQLSRSDGSVITGPIDEHTPPATIEAAAQACTMRALAALHAEINLDRVSSILFLRGFVFAKPAFGDHSRVLDHVSNLLTDIFGEQGEHARSAVGVSSLPSGGMLEIELVVAVKPA